MIKGTINPQSKFLNDDSQEILVINGETLFPVFEEKEIDVEEILTAEVFDENDFRNIPIQDGVYAE